MIRIIKLKNKHIEPPKTPVQYLCTCPNCGTIFTFDTNCVTYLNLKTKIFKHNIFSVTCPNNNCHAIIHSHGNYFQNECIKEIKTPNDLAEITRHYDE